MNNKSDKIERRCFEAEDQEMRLDYEGKTPKITGYAARFNITTELWKGFKERISPGAFTEAIDRDDVRALINHDPSLVLGRNRANTLKLFEDDKGLRYEIIPPDTQAARDLMVSMKRGDINQSSFGFVIQSRKMETNEAKNEMTRVVEKVKLFDVSPVTYPAYPQTEAHVRMMTTDKNELAFCVEDEVIETIPMATVGELEQTVEERKSTADYLNEIDEFLKKV